jgi:predicted GIY-YIG superfamily endonuclease
MFPATVYKLSHEDGHFIIGSTNDYRVRMKNHKVKRNEGNSNFQKHVRENGGWDKVKSEILKQWECSDRSEMLKEEGCFIDEVYEQPLCLNMKRAGLGSICPIGKIYKWTIAGKWIYFGSTRDIYKRQASHKTALKTRQSLLYRTVRENGGWDAIVCEVLKEWECSDSELKATEDEYIRQNRGSEFLLNSMPASTTPEREKELSEARVKRWIEAHPEEAKESARRRTAAYRARKKAQALV